MVLTCSPLNFPRHPLTHATRNGHVRVIADGVMDALRKLSDDPQNVVVRFRSIEHSSMYEREMVLMLVSALCMSDGDDGPNAGEAQRHFLWLREPHSGHVQWPRLLVGQEHALRTGFVQFV